MAHAGRSNLIFSATLYGHREAMWEVVISDDETVIYAHRPPGVTDYRTEELNIPWRDVSDLLWELEDNILPEWDKDGYGKGEVGKPGYWMVMLERDRVLHKWQGFAEYPPKWGRFTSLVENTIDRAFGV